MRLRAGFRAASEAVVDMCGNPTPLAADMSNMLLNAD
jgi:hypothetical protein